MNRTPAPEPSVYDVVSDEMVEAGARELWSHQLPDLMWDEQPFTRANYLHKTRAVLIAALAAAAARPPEPAEGSLEQAIADTWAISPQHEIIEFHREAVGISACVKMTTDRWGVTKSWWATRGTPLAALRAAMQAAADQCQGMG